MSLHKETRPDGMSEYPGYAWPGGYPIVYFTRDGTILCPDCANGKNGSIASETEDDPQWQLVDHDCHYEGESIPCDHCDRLIHSAYGPVDGEDFNSADVYHSH